MQPSIAITGIVGGVGATTLVAQLAYTFSKSAHQVVAFDFSPHNSLRLHLGGACNQHWGLSSQLLAGERWKDAPISLSVNIQYLPFGRVSGVELAKFNAEVTATYNWLASKLDAIDSPPNAYRLIDAPFSSPLTQQAWELSDVIMVVIECDSMSYAALPEFIWRIPSALSGRIRYVINGFDPTRQLDRDLLKLMRAGLGNQLCPIIIHRDESVREAFSSKICLSDYQPESQANADIEQVATWLITLISQKESRKPVEVAR
jgi:cellulose synthase operon protein YhjQ